MQPRNELKSSTAALSTKGLGARKLAVLRLECGPKCRFVSRNAALCRLVSLRDGEVFFVKVMAAGCRCHRQAGCLTLPGRVSIGFFRLLSLRGGEFFCERGACCGLRVTDWASGGSGATVDQNIQHSMGTEISEIKVAS